MRVALFLIALAVAGCGAPRPVLLQPLPHAVPPPANVAASAEATLGGGGGRVWVRPTPGVALYGVGRVSRSSGPVIVIDDGRRPRATEWAGGGGLAVRVGEGGAVALWATAEHVRSWVESGGRVPEPRPPCPFRACADAGVYRARPSRTALGVLLTARREDDFGDEGPSGALTLGLSLRSTLARTGDVRFYHRADLSSGETEPAPADGQESEPVALGGRSAVVVEPAVVVGAEVGGLSLTGQVGISTVLTRGWSETYATDGLLGSVGVVVRL